MGSKLKGSIYSIDVKKEKIRKGKKIFTHFNERVVKRDKIKCLAAKSCVEVILKDCQIHFPLNSSDK
jgi:hypothetical protein